jgi:hypothetical protein
MNETKLNLDAEVAVEHALHFCSDCLIDLPTNGGRYIECAGCGELVHYECTNCLCERKRTAVHT